MTAMTAGVRQSAATCRWAVATVSLPSPTWLDAEASPWTCVRDATARVLVTTEQCADCGRWEPRVTATDRRI
jgi:hypothetical protein